MSDNRFVLYCHSVCGYLSVAFLGFHLRVLGQQLLPKVPDKRGSLAASPSNFFSPTCQRSCRKKFFVGNPIHENITTRNNKTRKFYYTKNSRYTVVNTCVCILAFPQCKACYRVSLPSQQLVLVRYLAQEC